MDLMYISEPSLFEDFKIMFATVKILFMKESTAGVAEGQTTAMGKNDWYTLNLASPRLQGGGGPRSGGRGAAVRPLLQEARDLLQCESIRRC